MIDAKIPFHLSASDLPILKIALAFHLKAIPPSLRPEFVARALGFHTAAGFRHALETSPDREFEVELTFDQAESFALSRGHCLAPRGIYDVLASVVMVKEALRDPEINDIGYGGRHLWPRLREIRSELDAVPIHMRNGVWSAIWSKRIAASRASIVGVRRRDGLLHALAYASQLRKIRTVQEKGSYFLKHRAEETPFRLSGNVVIGRNYVSNTDMIIAMLHLGFKMNGRHRMEQRLNPRFNYSMKSVLTMTRVSADHEEAA